jgi:hypothetical protein
MNDFLIITAFFVMVLAPGVISLFSIRKEELEDFDPESPEFTRAHIHESDQPLEVH